MNATAGVGGRERGVTDMYLQYNQSQTASGKLADANCKAILRTRAGILDGEFCKATYQGRNPVRGRAGGGR